ncbi:MAG TPA: reactive intermediate/imine deaminase [Bacteroidales bacterium]|nr:reactive intermediate/imine deaminase [Bacteroidales bacterium]
MKTIINTPSAPAPIGPYNQAVLVNGTLYVSGQIPLDPTTGKLVEGDIKAQALQVMQNLGAILQAAGLDFSNVVKCSIFLKDMHDFPKVNEVYGRFFTANPPARETVQVGALPMFVDVEISCIAVE